MKIEVLYPEICNLFGDFQNMIYLRQCLPDAEFIDTDIKETPLFANEDVDMVYLGSMTENTQKKVISNLLPYKDRIIELAEKGTIFLFTGNAYEIVLSQIENVTEESVTKGLGIFDLNVKTDLFKRYNKKMLCRFDDFELVGFKSSFSKVYGDNSGCFFAEVVSGMGINDASMLEGVRRNNFIGTGIIGPILPLNPPFTQWIMQQLGAADCAPAFYDVAMKAYKIRLEEFHNADRMKF